MARRKKQLSLAFRQHGGARKGAGRKPSGDKAGVSHLRRPSLSRHHPVHVTLRVRGDVPSLRTKAIYRAIARAFMSGALNDSFRVIHYSIQGNHIHLIFEAADRRALAKGMQGLGIRMARGINRVSGHKGRVFADRYHARALRTPSEVRNAVEYVVRNGARHDVRVGKRNWPRGLQDMYSSEVLACDDDARFARKWLGYDVNWIARPRLWLLKTGSARRTHRGGKE